MKKAIVLSLLLSLMNLVLLLMVAFTIESNRKTIERIAPPTEELRFKNNRMGSLRLTENEVREICNKLSNQINELKQIKRILTFIAACITLYIVWAMISIKWHIVRFDGLTLLIAGVLLFGFPWFYTWFIGRFEEGHNATIQIRIVTETTLLTILPLLFFTAYKVNNLEIVRRLHAYKWISVLSLFLSISCMGLLLILGIGILITPDLGGNWG